MWAITQFQGIETRCDSLCAQDQPAIAQPSLQRWMTPREHRYKVLIQARMRYGGAWTDVCIRDISSRGMLLQAAAPPQRGTYVEIYRATHRIIGRVVWTKDRRFGIHSQQRIDVSGMMEEPAVAGSGRGPAPATQVAADRRSEPRQITSASVAQRLERSRRMSAAFEFGCVVACGIAAAAIAVNVVYDTLSAPFRSVSEHLAR